MGSGCGGFPLTLLSPAVSAFCVNMANPEGSRYRPRHAPPLQYLPPRGSSSPSLPPKVGLYTCGPTVYLDAHIGNFRTYVFETSCCARCEWKVMRSAASPQRDRCGPSGATGTMGEDKVHKAAIASGKTAWDIANPISDLFLGRCQDAEYRNSRRAVSQFRDGAYPEQIEIVERLEKNGFTYRTSDGIYF